MRLASILTVLTAAITMSSASTTTTTKDGLIIEVLKSVESNRRTANGDTVQMHYRGTLADTGKQFDASYDRGTPLGFTIGKGMVIKGYVSLPPPNSSAGEKAILFFIPHLPAVVLFSWEQGLLDMAVGEKRKLTIPPSLAYGSRGVGPIPGDATLIFEAELMEISKGEL